MAAMIFNTRVKNKRDTNTNLESTNPVLLNGEIVIVDHETEGMKLKIGDGVSEYNSLPYFGAIYSEKPVYTYQEISGLENILNDLQSQIQLIPVIPSGAIMIWSGSESDIPDGWVLCNGTNGTPDLSDKFVIGAGSKYNPGDIGGEETVTLTTDETPSHSHTFGHNVVTSDTNGSYILSNSSKWGYYNATIISNTESVGGDQAHNNMPPYYALCYIMKI